MNRKASYKSIPQSAWRVLDAPDLNNDYYLNLLDWSVSNLLCVALNDSVYIWNAASGDITVLTEVCYVPPPPPRYFLTLLIGGSNKR